MKGLWYSINDGLWRKSRSYILGDEPLSAQSVHMIQCCFSNEVVPCCVGKISAKERERRVRFGYKDEAGEIVDLDGWRRIAEQHYRDLKDKSGWR